MVLTRLAARALRMVRFGNWWAHKIPPLLLVAYIELSRDHAPLHISVASIFVLVFCVSCVAAYGHVVNDWCDIAEDERAGKQNTMRDVPIVRRAALAVAFVACGFLALVPVPHGVLPRIVLAANYLWPTLYSIPGVRLKERGLLGVLTDALGSHITPTVFAFAITFSFMLARPSAIVVAAVLLWASALGLKGILYHQVFDQATDRIAGVRTFAARFDPKALMAVLARYNFFVELPISVFLTFVIASFMPTAVIALLVYTSLETVKYRLGFEFSHGSDERLRRASIPFANEMLYTLWLPLAGALQLAIDDVALVWLPIVHGFLFNEQVVAQAHDMRATLSAVKVRLFGA